MSDNTNKVNMDLLLQELQGRPGNPLRIKEFFYLCLAKWRWFVISVLLCVAVAAFYILCTPPVYTRSAFLMVKEDTKGKAIGSDVASMFADLGMGQMNTDVNNELLALRMPSVIKEVVRRLSLDVNYRTGGFPHKETLYGKELPVKVSMPGLEDAESASFTVRLQPGGKVELDDFESSERDVGDGTVTGALNDTLRTPLGKMIVTPAPSYSATEEYPPIHLTRTNLYDCVDGCIEKLTAELSSEDATVIELSYEDVSIARAEDVLGTVIDVYNEEWMEDKNRIAVSTSQFISNRLEILMRELGDVDSDISAYKSRNLLPDVEKASEIYMEQAKETDNQLIAIGIRITVAKNIREHLADAKNRNRLLPVNLGLESVDIERQIDEYNAKQIRRNNLILNSSEQNPLIADLDQSLSAMRTAITAAIDNLMVSLETQRGEILNDRQKTSVRIAASPEQGKYLQSVGRQQKVKEALYLFLLQKREENEISQAFTPYNVRILTPPSGNLVPVAPKKKRILAVAFLLGLMLPAGFILLRENLNTTVRGRKDLETLAAPLVGEIPLDTDENRKRLFGKRKEDKKRIVVREGGNDLMNEAFRVLRTNLEFMSDGRKEVILLTSFNPGSGKTFLTMNIAASLAIKGKRVLVIDGDLRHATLSAYAGSHKSGLSGYLAGRTGSVDEIVRTAVFGYDGLDMIPTGTIPPNPTELLSGERMAQLVAGMRARYDYVFIDCPPVDIVADTRILEKFSDRVLFVVRSGLLERSMLPQLDKAYKERTFRNLSVILNGTPVEKHRYGYRNGYYYGYGYGSREK